MKHSIMFDVGLLPSLASYTVNLEFNSNKMDSELMRYAFKKLDAEMKRRGHEEYTTFYWWWQCTGQHSHWAEQ